MEQFQITTEPVDGVVLVHVHGELDLATAPELRTALQRVRDEGPARIALDLRRCSFIDSSGTREIGVAARALAAEGRELSVVCPPSNALVWGVLDLLGIGQVVKLHDDLPEPP